MSAIEVAREYTSRGWRVIPIPHQAKNPGLKAWQQLRLDDEALPHHFNGKPQNIGILLGEPSGWLVDVDLDHPRAVELAAQYLPPTPLRFGRSGKPESHWIYRVDAPVATKKHNSKSAGMIVELRSTGTQTVFPPSVHPSGESIEFVDPLAEPAVVSPDVLLDGVKSLADSVRTEIGEKSAPRPGRERRPQR